MPVLGMDPLAFAHFDGVGKGEEELLGPWEGAQNAAPVTKGTFMKESQGEVGNVPPGWVEKTVPNQPCKKREKRGGGTQELPLEEGVYQGEFTREEGVVVLPQKKEKGNTEF